ncbi:MAG: metal-sensing transcriptional repressor [Rhizobiales bacterium]|nr:metal-sensing transcriptional repressor [Hyphomicrobiales bacterium]
MADDHLHQTHPEISKRLRRAEGHLRSVIEMIENGRSCLDLAQQLHAVEKAIGQAKKNLIQDHLDHCLDDAIDQPPKERRRSVEQFKAIAKYL